MCIGGMRKVRRGFPSTVVRWWGVAQRAYAIVGELTVVEVGGGE